MNTRQSYCKFLLKCRRPCDLAPGESWSISSVARSCAETWSQEPNGRGRLLHCDILFELNLNREKRRTKKSDQLKCDGRGQLEIDKVVVIFPVDLFQNSACISRRPYCNLCVELALQSLVGEVWIAILFCRRRSNFIQVLMVGEDRYELYSVMTVVLIAARLSNKGEAYALSIEVRWWLTT